MEVSSACLTDIERVEVRPRRLEPAPDEVLVRTRLAGICGSDKNLYQGIIPPSGGLNTEMRRVFGYPYFFGHEAGGVVEAVGSKVRGFKPGDRVMAFAWVETFSNYFKAFESDLEPAPEGLEMDLAFLGEPIACAVFSGLRSGIRLGDTVAVFGLGFAGQIMAQVAKASGAHQTIGVDVVEAKLKTAGKLGLDHGVNAASDDPVEAILDLTQGRGADVVVEMAGTEKSINQCSASVRHNGTLVFYSWVTQDIRINISRWHNNSLKVVNTGLVHHGQRQRSLWTPMALRPVRQNQIDIHRLITHRFGLSRIQEAFDTALNDPSAIKVVIDPHE